MPAPAPASAMRRRSLRWLLPPPHGFRTLCWWEWGPEDAAAPPLVCVHGLTRTGRDFDALAAALAAEGRRVVCPDLPGRGASDPLPDPMLYVPPTYVAAMAFLLARLDAPAVDWLGTSLGAVLGMAIAATPGHPVRRLVLNDTGFEVPAAAIARIRDYVGAAPHAFPDLPALEAHLRDVHAPFGPLTDAEWRHLAETSAVAGPDGEGVRLHYDPGLAAPILATEPAALDLRALWDRVEVPVLLLHGAESDLLTTETADAMAARPGTTLARFPGIGHAPALMDPAQIGLVARFLR